MSCETTFERDLHAVRDRPELSAVFTSLCERLAADLSRHGYAGRTIGVKLRYDNFQSITRAQTLDFHTADAAVIRRTAGQCLKRAPLDRRLRLLGVRVGSLVSAAEAQTLAQAPPAESSLDLF
jgi:DNA polymerase-4